MSYHEPESDLAPNRLFLNRSVSSDEFTKSLLRETNESFKDWLGNDGSTPADSSLRSAPAYTPKEPREISFEGTLRVDGYLAGVVRSPEGTLVLSDAGEIDGNVIVKVARIYGCVRGDIRAATKVELGSDSRVIGDIETLELSIQPGAVFEGRCALLPAPKKSPKAAEPTAEDQPDNSAGTAS